MTQPDENTVSLTYGEMLAAINVGGARQMKRFASETASGPLIEPWRHDIVNAAAEFAVSKFFNLAWTGAVVGTPATPVGNLIDVRAVWGGNRMWLDRADEKRANVPFVQVIAVKHKFTLAGWLFGHEAMSEKNLDKEFDAWIVPDDALTPISKLTHWVSQNR